MLSWCQKHEHFWSVDLNAAFWLGPQNPVVDFDLPLQLESWFPRQQVRQKREEIRNLILKLHQTQSNKKKTKHVWADDLSVLLLLFINFNFILKVPVNVNKFFCFLIHKLKYFALDGCEGVVL